MKVILTLNRGSFYFLKHVHLIRNVPTEVDLSVLDDVELVGVKSNVKAGTILADKDISAFGENTQEVVGDTDADLEVIPEVLEEQEVVTKVSEDVEETLEVEAQEVTTEDFRELSNKMLKEKLAELGVEPTSNRKDDLIAQLVEVTNK